VLCDEAVINKSRRMVGILSLVTSAIRRPVIYCPNASRAFRLIARRKIYARRARSLSIVRRPAHPVLVGNLRSEILVVQSAQNRHRQRETDSLDGTDTKREPERVLITHIILIIGIYTATVTRLLPFLKS